MPLNIGVQVHAVGVLIFGQYLTVDESSITEERKIVHKDSSKFHFPMSGCKIVDASGTMLVTSVGIITDWDC